MTSAVYDPPWFVVRVVVVVVVIINWLAIASNTSLITEKLCIYQPILAKMNCLSTSVLQTE
ncbi:hypothetical protein [Calothrix sp. NIES-2098]|uniref:hypothetical protein n=1 Tax=Calothrix sp. NIES-2098 TaxID=1954171 RepID=UPI0030D9170F